MQFLSRTCRAVNVILFAVVVKMQAAVASESAWTPVHPDVVRTEANEKLFMAAMTGELDEAVDALAAGADPNFRNQHGITPLLVVAGGSARNVAIMDALLESGANVNGADDERWTAIVYAASSGQMPFMDLLLRKGADVNVRTIDKDDVGASPSGTPTGGWTPLTRAAFRGQPNAVRALLEAGADTGARTGGRTALELASAGAEEGHAETVALLTEWLSKGRTAAAGPDSGAMR